MNWPWSRPYYNRKASPTSQLRTSKALTAQSSTRAQESNSFRKSAVSNPHPPLPPLSSLAPNRKRKLSINEPFHYNPHDNRQQCPSGTKVQVWTLQHFVFCFCCEIKLRLFQRVYLGVRKSLGKCDCNKMIILGSLLTTFRASYIWPFKLVQISDTHGILFED